MNKQNRKFGTPGLTLVCALALSSAGWAADVITTDSVNGYEGVLQGATSFVPANDRPHAAGSDYAIDLTPAGGGVLVADATFLSATAANDVLTFAFWVKKYDMENSSAFWLHATSQDRAFQAHTPWSDNNIYFDTAGCCNAGETRINASTDTFAGYTDATWWDDWHHFVFFKSGPDKQIWIDGQLFLQGTGSTPLPTDLTSLNLGCTVLGANSMHGQMDDFAIFANALSPADIASLFAGTAPDALGGANQLVAYWDFNDAPVFGQPVGTPLGFTIKAFDVGNTMMDQNTVELSLNGAAVTPTSVVKTGSVTAIEYLLPNPPFTPGSTNSVDLTMKDTGGASYSSTSFFVVSDFGYLTSDMALPPASVNKSLTGFKIRTYQVDTTIGQNGVQVAEDILAGTYGPNVAYLQDLTGVDGRGYYTFPDVINLDTGVDPAQTYGRFTAPDYSEFPFPGIPGNSSQYVYFACEIYAAFEFTQAGLYTMVVNSDDCFATSSGPNPLDTLTTAQLGRFDSDFGRGSADTSFQLYVESPGLYGFRTVYQQGGGAGNLEWFMVNGDGTRVLINDTTNAIPAFQWLPIPTAAYVSSLIPVDKDPTAGPSLVQATIVDGPTPVSTASVSLTVDGVAAAATISKTDNEILVSYVPDPLFAKGSTHTATLAYTDAGNPVTRVWTFTVAPFIYFAEMVEVAASSEYSALYPVIAAFNGSGLSPDGNTHATSGIWSSLGDLPISDEWVKVRFDKSYPLNHLRVWNYNEPGYEGSGVRSADIYVIDSDVDPGNNTHLNALPFDPTGWTLVLTDQAFVQAPSGGNITNTDPHISLGGVTARQLAFKFDESWGDEWVGLGEVQIYPTPLTTQPNISLDVEGNLVFTGVLQESDAVTGGWTDLLEAASPYAMPKTGAMKFYRTRD